jgi:tripartite-type tricarboxylate transporter receptor subunit TctC
MTGEGQAESGVRDCHSHTTEGAMGAMKAATLAITIGLLGTPALLVTPAQAEPWPQRTVTLITPMAAGTAADFAARLYANALAKRWGKAVIVDNRPGGDQITGTTAFARMNDDHALLFTNTSPIAVHPVIYEKLPYDPVRDFLPISTASDIFVAIAATESLKVTSVEDLVKLARTQSGKINWASAPGITQYVFATFERRSQLGMTRVPYRELAPALQDLSEGRIHVMAHSLSALMPVLQAGTARLLAVHNRQRAAIAPEVPTVVEAGYSELAFDGFCGLFAWRHMSKELIERIAADVRAIATDPVIGERLASVGQVARGSTPAEFSAALEQQRAAAEAMVRVVGITPNM